MRLKLFECMDNGQTTELSELVTQAVVQYRQTLNPVTKS
jgi:hypothetical protein